MTGRQRAARIVLFSFVFVGSAGLIVGSYVLFRSLAIVVTGRRADGVVTENHWSGPRRPTAHPVVRFEADGNVIELKGKIGRSPPAYSVNDKVTVYYIPGNPQHAIIDSLAERYLLASVLYGFGAFFLGLGGGCLWLPAWLAHRRQGIVTAGIPTRAKVVEIHIDRSLKVDGKSPWVIVAQFKDELSDQLITCTSHYLWEDPKWQYPPGSEVVVYHLPNRPDKCAIQLDKSVQS